MNVSYDYYKIFYNVAKYKSFTRAAEIMLCNQPNLTRAVKALERDLGCTLFERTNKGVRLTDDGKELYEHISAAFEHIEAGEKAISAKRNMEHGMVTIGATEIALRCCLLPVLKQYHQIYPGVRIKILNVSTPQALKMAENRLVDIAVVTTPIDVNTKLKMTTLTTFREVPVCSDNFKVGIELSIHELSLYPIISLSAKTSTFDFYVQEFLKHNCSFSPDIEAATADQIIPLVKYDLGIGFVPEQFLENETGIRKLNLKESLATRDVVLIRKYGYTLPLPAQELVNLLKS